MAFGWLTSPGVFQNLIIIFPYRLHWDETRTYWSCLQIYCYHVHLLMHTDPVTLQHEDIWKWNKNVKKSWPVGTFITRTDCSRWLHNITPRCAVLGDLCPNKTCSFVSLHWTQDPSRAQHTPALARVLQSFAGQSLWAVSGCTTALHHKHWGTSIVQLAGPFRYWMWSLHQSTSVLFSYKVSNLLYFLFFFLAKKQQVIHL